jgi:dTDP-4-amino-4,6-dideoxygalactose transaminase
MDLRPMHAPIREAILRELAELIDTNAYTGGAQVAEFEAAFAVYCGVSDCVGVASGLDALRLALLAAGIQPGDEVLVPAFTFVATFEAVTQAGGTPVPVDVRDDDFGIDAAAVEAAVTDRTRFVMPVHLYGQMADVPALREACAHRGVAIVEDACQAHGAARNEIRAGTGGIAGGFSFYPSKNLGALGDAGAVVTDDVALADRVRLLREHGASQKYEHVVPGYTARLDTIQAIALLHKLPLLESWNDQRRRSARLYDEALAGIGDLRLPVVASGSLHAWHLYVIRTSAPVALAAFLAEHGIGTGRHYPQPPHLSRAYAHLGYEEGMFPIAEAISRECLSLPMFPGLAEQHVAIVAGGIRDYFDG